MSPAAPRTRSDWCPGIWPWVGTQTTEPTHGHTPGHTCWLLSSSGGGGFMALGDVVHVSAIQIAHPDVCMIYDLDKEQAVRSRKRILDMAATERFAIAGAHVNAPGFGYVVRKGATFGFEPAG